MTTTETQLFPPALRSQQGEPQQPPAEWHLTIQALLKLRTVDTSAGNYGETVPPAGLTGATGQSNQNQEIVYKKISSDGNTFTLSGTTQSPLVEGPLTLTGQYASLRIKSDGTQWWKVD